jgi:hypothetical protein
MRLRTTTALVAAVLALASGCGGASEAEKARETDFDKVADLSTCVADAAPAATPYPDGFPGDWQFPAHTVVFNAEDRDNDGTIISAITATTFPDVLAFLNGPVSDSGYPVTNGETEDHDAEANWAGNGFHGRWAIRESATCPGETVIQVLSAKD